MINYKVFPDGVVCIKKGKPRRLAGCRPQQAVFTVSDQRDLWFSSAHRFISALAAVFNNLHFPFAKRKAPSDAASRELLCSYLHKTDANQLKTLGELTLLGRVKKHNQNGWKCRVFHLILAYKTLQQGLS